MIKQIRYFHSVVKLGSFSKAAEECFISQSAISQQIQALERELDVKLLDRKGRHFELTPAGEHFYQQSLLLLSDFDRLIQETRRIDHGDNFVFRIGHNIGYGGFEFQKALAQFSAKYPEIPVEIRNGNHEELYQLLQTDQVDLVLNDQRRAFSDEYVNFILDEISCEIEISENSPLANLDSIRVNDLRNTPCILIASQDQRENEMNYYKEIYGIKSRFIFAENLDEARLMVIGGQGFLPIEGSPSDKGSFSSIIRLPLYRNDKPISRNYCAFWKVDNSGFLVEEFAELLKNQYQSD